VSRARKEEIPSTSHQELLRAIMLGRRVRHIYDYFRHFKGIGKNSKENEFSISFPAIIILVAT